MIRLIKNRTTGAFFRGFYIKNGGQNGRWTPFSNDDLNLNTGQKKLRHVYIILYLGILDTFSDLQEILTSSSIYKIRASLVLKNGP